MEGLLYEPRSLWSIANVVARDTNTTPVRVQMNRQHFTNRTRWPMTFKRVAIAPINYTWNQSFSPFGGNAILYNQGGDAIEQVSLSVSAPQRYHLNSKRVINASTCTPRPTWDPPSAQTVVGINFAPELSALHNTTRLLCDYPLYIPRTAAVEWQMSAFSPVVFGDAAADPPEQAPFTDNSVHVTMMYQERGGMFFGNNRQHRYDPQPWVPPGGEPLNPLVIDSECWPFPPDMMSAVDTYTQIPGIPNWWDPRGLFSAKSFKDQEANRDGSTAITDLRVSIDQFLYDVQVAQAFENVYPDLRTTQSLTPMSLRMGTRIRTVGCGSGAWWWRPGAPVALVFDDKTPALVYELREQITLEPGDTLDVEITVPSSIFVGGEGAAPVPYHIGVSFNGYSPIEG